MLNLKKLFAIFKKQILKKYLKKYEKQIDFDLNNIKNFKKKKK